MLSASTIILEYVCPGLGCIIANLMFAAPFRSVRKAVKNASLGDLNPVPWAFMTGNCIGWTVYSVLIGKNLFVFFANVFGFLLSVYLNLCATKLQYHEHHATALRQSFLRKEGGFDAEGEPFKQLQQQSSAAPSVSQENLVMMIVILWTGVISLVAFSDFPSSTDEIIVGMVTNMNLLVFYGAPLSTIFAVLRTRNSASIHVGTMLMNSSSAFFWAVYGLVIQDMFIFVPNGIGTALGAIQLVLYLVLPRRPTTKATVEGTITTNISIGCEEAPIKNTRCNEEEMQETVHMGPSSHDLRFPEDDDDEDEEDNSSSDSSGI